MLTLSDRSDIVATWRQSHNGRSNSFTIKRRRGRKLDEEETIKRFRQIVMLDRKKLKYR